MIHQKAPLLLLVLAALAGCPAIGRDEWSSVRDRDGDGVDGERFGGDDCRDDDPSIQRCDVDGDGRLSLAAGGDDCDDLDPNLQRREFWNDADLDGYGDESALVDGCSPPPGTVTPGLADCDDTRGDVNPGEVEQCDDLDRDCVDGPYNADGDLFFVDADLDGFGAALSTLSGCVPPAGYSLVDGDCNDHDPDSYPGGTEVWYDGIDQACDLLPDDDRDGDGDPAVQAGGSDCDDDDPTRASTADEACNGVDDDCDQRVDDDDDDEDQVGQLVYHQDGDRDGFGSLVTASYCSGAVPPGWTLLDGDCRDDLATAHPGGTERCNLVDDDCNELVDDGEPLGAVPVYADTDGDGWGDVADSVLRCSPATGETLRGGDCNDADPAAFPGAPELCGDLVRQDCDPDLSPDDCDGDGYPTVLDPENTADCLDDPAVDARAAAVHPGADEVCDGLDNDCDTLTDGADPGVDPASIGDWYADADGDGYGDGPPIATRCSPPADSAANADDCDDSDPARNPARPEACNGVDDDCDLAIDEGATVNLTTFYFDFDQDGLGRDDRTVGACVSPGTIWAATGGDCDDFDVDVNPAAEELCNAVDDDCDAVLDDADPDLASPVWFVDADQDGWGLASDPLVSCDQPPAHTLLPGDCDDGRAGRNPGATEVCDGGLDNDCDALADDADPDLTAATTFYLDADLDGYGDVSVPVQQCGQPPGYVTNPFDCDDTETAISPGADEICDGVDNDCDDDVDQGDASVVGLALRYLDPDGDGWGSIPVLVCDPAGTSGVSGDCDESSPAHHPGALELCDRFDDDCDGTVDDGALPQLTWFRDADSDGFGVSSDTTTACEAPSGYVSSALDEDCDDLDRNTWPDHPIESCDGRDNDCDTLVDDLDDDTARLAEFSWFDGDGDLYGAGAPVAWCAPPTDWVAVGGDCDDADGQVNPGNGSCTGGGTGGVVVHGTPGKWWEDDDADGYGNFERQPRIQATEPVVAGITRWVTNPLDCDDTDANDVFALGVDSPPMLESALELDLPCLVLVLSDGFDGPLQFAEVGAYPPRTGKLRVTSAGATPASLQQVGNNPIFSWSQISGLSSMILHQLHLIGNSTTGYLVNVADCMSTVDNGLADLELEGAPGVIGPVHLEGLYIHDLVTNIDGAAIHNSSYAGTTSIYRTKVEDVRTSAGFSAVRLGGGLVRDLSVVRSGPVEIAPSSTFGATTTDIKGLAVLDAIRNGVEVDSSSAWVGSTVVLDRVLVSNAGAYGVLGAWSSSGLSLNHLSVVGSAQTGVKNQALNQFTVSNSIVVGDSAQDFEGPITRTRDWFESSTGGNGASVGGVLGLQTWHPLLDPGAWDLHLSFDSTQRGAGTDNDDLGYYPSADPWYASDDPDTLPDGWELWYFGDLDEVDTGSADTDGWNHRLEYEQGTDPTLPDTDNDGLDDDVDTKPLDPTP